MSEKLYAIRLIYVLREEDIVGKVRPDGGPPIGTYKLLGNGVVWKVAPVSYVIDPDNPQGLAQSFITSAVFASAEEWDSYTVTELFNDNYSTVYDATLDTEVRDNRNEILFDNYPVEGVIAVAVIWGVFRGPPELREIVEVDIMFDTDYTWGDATVDPTVMDLQNIATHEFGHFAGLDDVRATEETMYLYTTWGETKKRDLYYGDIAGIQELYG